ncbi:MAG: hypothetical protein JJU29_04420 [Verrucomicrobia bacterium]|nr:hypothetical protein [Verrucomicrobiota bacterium]MCH8512080.1 hypothetical protein [Kiritimatiellia bacterium]
MILLAVSQTALAQYGERIRVQGDRFYAGEREIWINGVNTPWQAWNDFGGDFDADFWDAHFNRLKKNGVNATRIWMSGDGDGGIRVDESGKVIGATEAHWQDLDTLFELAARHEIYILATLISFDHTKTGNPRHEAWRKMYLRDEGIASMMRNYVRPFVERHGENPWLFAIEPGNELEWTGVPGDNDAGIPKDRIIRYVAEVARTVRTRSKVLVTQGAASIRWNSDKHEGNWWSDESLQSQIPDPAARLDFDSPHYYDWQLREYGKPFQMNPKAYGLRGDRPAMIAESPARGSRGHRIEEDFLGAHANGWRGIMPWTSNGVDDYGDLSDIAPGLHAIWARHPDKVYPRHADAPPHPLLIFHNHHNLISDTWALNGALHPIQEASDEQGVHFSFHYELMDYWAGFALNLDHWGRDPAYDLSKHGELLISYEGPSTPGHEVIVRLRDNLGENGLGDPGPEVTLPRSEHPTVKRIPLHQFQADSGLDLSRIKEIQISVGGAESETGTLVVRKLKFTKSEKPGE